MSISKTQYNSKVVIIGDSGVGKSCLINRYMTGKYDENLTTSEGASYANKIVSFNNHQVLVSMDIWDTAGEERYRSITKNFFINATIGVMVYDITRPESFQNIKNYWYNEIRNYGNKNIVLAIAANKIDLYERENVDRAEVQDFAKSIGATIYDTSPKENLGIVSLFKECAKKFLRITVDNAVAKNIFEYDNIVDMQSKEIVIDRDTISPSVKSTTSAKTKCC